MTKIYEALEQANHERVVLHRPVVSVQPQQPSLDTSRMGLQETMVALYRNIFTLLPDSGGKAIQFMGTKKGEGASTIIREFAKAASQKLGKSVVLLDADRSHRSQLSFFGMRSAHGYEEAIAKSLPVSDVLHQVGNSSLFISQMSVNPIPASAYFNGEDMTAFFRTLKQKFDLVLLDSPSVMLSSDGVALSRNADGVVLVVEAEKTRWQVAGNAAEKINSQGGTILGVVLNKRRYPIPEFFYRWI